VAVKFDSEFLIDDLHVRRSTACSWRDNPRAPQITFEYDDQQTATSMRRFVKEASGTLYVEQGRETFHSVRAAIVKAAANVGSIEPPGTGRMIKAKP
jgi:hypothetical protein